eukprot:UN26281
MKDLAAKDAVVFLDDMNYGSVPIGINTAVDDGILVIDVKYSETAVTPEGVNWWTTSMHQPAPKAGQRKEYAKGHYKKISKKDSS